ncbi:hypothetical protein H1R20_g9251, partial [Candolleomyces eurysporus]
MFPVALEAHVTGEALPQSVTRDGRRREASLAVQDELESWIEAANEAQTVRWVLGPASSGKTAILTSVAHNSDAKGLLAAGFFFSPSTEIEKLKQSFIPTLAYQLVQHPNLVGLGECILSAVNQCPSVFDLTPEKQLDTLILVPLRQQSSINRSSWPRVVIIDGLDKCQVVPYDQNHSGSDDRSAILQAILAAVTSSTFPFKVIIGSRPEPDFRAVFERAAKVTTTISLDQSWNTQVDMASFLQAKFSLMRRRHRLEASWPSSDLQRLLIQNAAGQFIYLKTIVRHLEMSRSPPQTTFATLLTNVVMPFAHSFSNPIAQLDKLYTYIVNLSPNPPLSALWLSLINEINCGRYCSGPERSFPARFLRQFLESFPGEAELLLCHLHSLVQIPSEDDATSLFSFYHKSFFEFLDSKERSGDLHANSVMRHKLYIERYLEISKGLSSIVPATQSDSLAPFAELDPFFERSLLYVGDRHLDCDPDWLMQLFVEKESARGIVALRPARYGETSYAAAVHLPTGSFLPNPIAQSLLELIRDMSVLPA